MKLSRNADPKNVRVPYKVLMVPAGKAYRCTCLTDGYVSLSVHYTGTGAKVCTNETDCPSCRNGSPQIFSGYFLGIGDGDAQVKLVHLTGLAAYMLKAMEWRSKSLHGARIILQRIGEKKNGPVESCIHGWRDDYQVVPMPRLEHAVSTLYKLHQLQKSLLIDTTHVGDLARSQVSQNTNGNEGHPHQHN